MLIVGLQPQYYQPLLQIIPLKVIAPNMREKTKYKQIFASIKEVGIIEPPAVTPCNDKSGRYYLLDGHLRIEALKDLKEKQIMCLVSTDDEAFTYNKHINRLSTIQEHKMIVRAVERGFSEEKIAKALNVDVRSIILKRKMLDGVCQEAIDLLKDKMVSGGVFRILKKMKPMRQIECAELMNSMNVYTVPYAKALLAGTPKERLIEPEGRLGSTRHGASAVAGTAANPHLAYQAAAPSAQPSGLSIQICRNLRAPV